ncbi:TIGR04255 family protein [Dehalococcoides mccartyi]|uniref:TIGR04255 family protein n=1 Tax=Dehalococcoides mccartyi TaxID=61435 RepID=A0AB33HVU2_9CHLR|nr:TIGR04255 family protein [Dehalococcoides mccartyi]BAZ96690.1 TIGR04255 family protein [Dehalococcoides mccartyi]
MARVRHLSHAPIQEAIIDFSIVAPNVDNEFLELLANNLKDSLPNYSILERLEQDPSCAPQNEPFISLSSKIDKIVIEITNKNIRVDKLAPYENWENLSDTILSVYKLYTSMNNIPIERISTRFINSISVELPLDLEEYLKLIPRLPNNLQATLGDFFVSYFLSIDDILASIILAGSHTENKGNAIIIDISTFYMVDQELLKNDGYLPVLLKHIRKYKNKIFFSTITEKVAGDLQ